MNVSNGLYSDDLIHIGVLMETIACIAFVIACWGIVSNAIPRIVRWTQAVTFAISAVGAGTIAHFIIGAMFK